MKTQKEIEKELKLTEGKLTSAKQLYSSMGETKNSPLVIQSTRKTMNRLFGEIKILKWVLDKE